MPSVGSGDRRFIGSILLVAVNILWVLSTELTSFIFIDEDFRRPFFTVYVKTCMLCIYFLRYLLSSPPETEHKYKVLYEESDLEMDELNIDALEPEGFETVSNISESDNEADPVRRIRFSERREVRRLPSSEAVDAQRARLPYRDVIACSDMFSCSPRLKYAVFFFAPMWLACSFTYQAALLFTSVSSLNLISSSSSLFVLILSTCMPSKKAKFTLMKAILVILNLAGVLIVSQFSTQLTGAVLAQISAVAYAIYLVMYARFMDRYGEIDMNLMFGSVGLLGVVVGTPLIYVLDVTGYEKLHPLPDSIQLGSIVLSAVFGTLLADYLWLMAAGMTDSVSASLSLTLSIPLSFLADSLFRRSPPSALQLFAAVPITLSFIGAALLEQNSSQIRVTVTGDQDQESLLTDEDDEPGESVAGGGAEPTLVRVLAAIAPAASMVPTTSKLSSSTPPSLLLPTGAFSPPANMLFGLPSPASSLENSSSPLQSLGTTSAFRPIVPTGDAFFLSAIHTLVLSTPGEDALSESNCSSDKSGSEDCASATNLLCQVCSDKASGFHYGVFACEGCKGFFRRSIQQKIQYRPCSRSQDCLIVRNNRNRCQYCRLKKCISVGMSRDAVRFGRVPKREKAKMVEDMQRTTIQSQMDAVAVQFENDNEAAERIQQAFNQLVSALDTCSQAVPGRCPLQFHSYLLGLKAVIDFANAIPGFLCLPQTERIILLKATCFDSLLVAWSTSQQPAVWMTSSLIFSQSLLQFSRRVRLMPTNCAAILCALAVVQPLPSQPLALRLAERLWLLMAKIGGTATITAAPSLLTEARALRICHNEFFRMPKPMTPLSISVPQDNLTAPMSTPRSSYRERHPSIASLLEKPVNLNLLSPASSKSGEHISCDSEDEPLNLCVRESNPMTKFLN